MPERVSVHMDDDSPKRRSGVTAVLLVGAVIVAMQWLRPPPVDAVMCERDLVPDAGTVVMLGASWCGYCAQARRHFDRREARWCEYDVESSDTGAQLFREHNGVGVPVILIGPRTLYGFSAAAVDEALTEL
ncbi:MAG: glutaredoxin family protein [Gammaproteobacteria bacterium]|nr:glutaredoxin family protein [Gammaproteobacteria bacterium]NNM00390.1 glutaredoxin family protein [Gammaproteobacteria bacterium]